MSLEDKQVIDMASSTAAIKGLCRLTEGVDRALNMSAEEVVCRQAVVLFRQKKETK